jgi:hypothetical protein
LFRNPSARRQSAFDVFLKSGANIDKFVT